jgi:hypothetical protein
MTTTTKLVRAGANGFGLRRADPVAALCSLLFDRVARVSEGAVEGKKTPDEEGFDRCHCEKRWDEGMKKLVKVIVEGDEGANKTRGRRANI